MRYPLIVAFVAFAALAACGSEEPAAGDTDADATPDSQAATEAEALPTETPPADEDELPTVVEESAAEIEEPASDEVPLVLAQADTSGAARDWQYSENEHFQRLVPTQPTVGGADRIEVAEIFWYGCNHCYNFEPYINAWADQKPASVRFVRIPAMWNPLVELHAKLYYTEEVLAKNGTLANPEEFHAAVFREYHQRGNRLASESAIQALFERFGVSAEDFRSAWTSFEVAQKLRVASDLARRYGVSSVPSVVVNGKYRTGASETVGLQELPRVIDELVAREAAR